MTEIQPHAFRIATAILDGIPVSAADVRRERERDLSEGENVAASRVDPTPADDGFIADGI